jgi:hypothetical protein
MKVFLSDVEGFGEDSLLLFTKLLVEVWNVQNWQKKTTYNNVPKNYKWGERHIIEAWCTNFQWTTRSKIDNWFCQHLSTN